MEHSSLITGHCHAAARRAATTFLSFLIDRLSKLSTSLALGMSMESLCCTRASDGRKNGRRFQITQICDEYMSWTSADGPQDLVQMSLQACKQAGCEIISACKWASLQQSRRVPAHSRACSSSLAGGHILTQHFIAHECLKQRPVLWSQPRPNILLPTPAQCSPETSPSCGLRNTGTAPCHLNGCKPPLFST